MPTAVFVPAQLNDLAVDVALSGVARGDVFYRGPTKWNNLPAGTSGQFLKTQGAGADPTWSGLAASDLAPAVILAPGSNTRNLITPTGDFTLLALQAFAGQTQPVLNITDSAANFLAQMDASGNIGIGQAASTAINWGMLKQRTDTSGTARLSQWNLQANAASNSSAAFRALDSQLTFLGSVNYTGGCPVLPITASHQGTGTISAPTGLSVTLQSTAGGAITTAVGANVTINLVTTAGTIGTARGFASNVVCQPSGSAMTTVEQFRAAAPTVAAGATIGTIYGVRVLNQGNAGITTSYGLRVDAQSGSATNYAAAFEGGVVGIGTAFPSTTAQLSVISTATGNLTLLAKAIASQSVDIFNAQNSAAAVLFGVGNGGLATHLLSDATTNVISDAVIIDHTTSGTPAAGFGQQLRFKAKSSTTASRNVGLLSSAWVVATDATRTSRMRAWASDATADRECIRWETDGTNAMVGFLGANATARVAITGSRGGNAALASLLTELASKGLITDSTTA